ncbi:MAG TPA: hypothetical protein VK469_03350 [Candidatus Kapabacteria bacterium]|nr:hypothetical protein [Candidatus Kapabacteria bacterium]
MKNERIQRCRKCIMPINYPQIMFDNEGVCNFCTNYKKIEYQGAAALKDKILSYHHMQKNSKYDCALGFSGGRDSTYLLYFLSSVLNLRVLAFFIDNGNIPAETFQNIDKIKKLLHVDIVTEKHAYLENCFNHHLKTWLHKPSPAMISALCVGCRFGLAKGKYELLQEYQIPVYISGGTPFEGNHFKTNLLRFPPHSQAKSSLVFGYILEGLKNTGWFSSPYAVSTQAKEFMAFFGKRYNKKLRRRGYTTISPFFKYIRWEESKIIGTIENVLGWQKNSQTGSTWRGDCDIALLKLYLYKKLLGYNDKDDSLSDLIRDGQMTREEALRRLAAEQYISESAIKNVVEKNGIDYGYFEDVMRRLNDLN